MSRSVIELVGDAIWPSCSRCREGFLAINDHQDRLKELKKVKHYSPSFRSIKHLCHDCWEKLSTKPCSLCKKKFSVLDNHRDKLLANWRRNRQKTARIVSARRICPACFRKNQVMACSRCGAVVSAKKNVIGKYEKNDQIEKWLAPYHRDFSESWLHLCPECLAACLSSCQDVKARLAKWVGTTKEEYVRGYRTTRTIGRVEYKGNACGDPGEVEEILRRYAVQLGANACVNYFWDKDTNRNTSRVVAGYGPRGNPYYKSQSWTQHWVTGSATAVVVEPFAEQRKSRR